MSRDVRKCIRGRVGEDGDVFSEDELQQIIDELEGRKKQRRAQGSPDGGSRELYADADRLAYDAKLAAAVTRRNSLLELQKKAEMRQRIAKFSLGKSTAGTGAKVAEQVKDVNGLKMVVRPAGGMDDVQGFMAQIAYSNKRVDSGHVSVESQSKAFHNQFMGEMYRELKQEGLADYLESRKVLGVGFGPGLLDREIGRELWEINNRNGRPGVSGSPEAQRIAAIVQKHMDRARIVLNRNGAWIRELTGYIATQSHDQMKLMSAGFEKWAADVMQGLDVARTFGKEMSPEELTAALQSVYGNLSTGNYSSEIPVGPVIDLGINLGKQVSHHRVLHFMDADRWMDYNDKYGSGSLFTAINNTLNRAARTAGLMSIFGANPRKVFEDMREELIKLNRGNAAVERALGKRTGQRVNVLMDVADGAVDQVIDPAWATRGQVIREMESASGLGGALLSSLSTDPMTAANQLTYNGMNALEAAHAATINLLAGDHSMGEHLAFGLDAMHSDISARFHGGDGVSAFSTKGTAVAMNLSLMPQFDRMRERAYVAALGSKLYSLRNTSWGGLDADHRGTLALYGIDEAHWNVIRRFGAVAKEDGEGGVITGSAMRHVPDSEILPLLNRRRATAQALDNKRDELEQMVRGYYSGQVEYGMARPGFRIKALTTMGLKRGTKAGEIARSFFLWKGYSLNFMQRVLGQFTEEDNYVPTLRGLYAMPMSRGMQMAGLMAAMTIGGYGSMVLKDVSKGRTPRDPRNVNTWLAAGAQGGGLGIYGDFLLGSTSRYGSSPLVQLAGPVASDLEALIKVASAAKDGKLEGTEVYNLVKPNTPLINLFYARAAFDYLILYRIQEWLNPGSLKRMERRLKQDNDQTYLLPPSQAIR